MTRFLAVADLFEGSSDRPRVQEYLRRSTPDPPDRPADFVTINRGRYRGKEARRFSPCLLATLPLPSQQQHPPQPKQQRKSAHIGERGDEHRRGDGGVDVEPLEQQGN